MRIVNPNIVFILLSLSTNIGAVVPDTLGIFFCPLNKDTALPCRSYNGPGSPDEGLSKRARRYPLFNTSTKLNAMLKNSSTCVSAPSQSARTNAIIRDILAVDNMRQLRDSLYAMGMTAIVNEDDQTARNEIYSSINSIDFILEALERIQK